MSGHSKWAQIKHKKAITDAKKGQLFSKIVRGIALAARSGGPNPETNPGLRRALERAQAQGVPKDNLRRALARASGNDDAVNLQEFLYEATAPGGILILIEGITDNKNRTLTEIKQILTRYGGKLAAPGSVLWNFDKIGIIEVEAKAVSAESKENLEMAIIESGATDFQVLNGVWIVETNLSELESVRQKLEQQKIPVKNSGFDYKSKSPLELPAEDKSRIPKILDEVRDQNEVQEIYSNIIEK